MKKNTKKFLSYSILGIFLFALVLPFIGAAEGDLVLPKANSGSGGSANLGPIGDWFAKWDDGNLSPNIAKYLLFALVSIVIFSVAGFIPGLDGDNMKKVRWAFAIIAGFLSMAYITPEEVYGIMVSYSALGFTLGIAMPFVILIFFTFQLSDFSGKNAATRTANKMLAIFLWAVFAVFAVLKAVDAPEGSVGVSWIVAVLAIAMAVSVKSIMIYIWTQTHKEKLDATKEKHDKVRVVEDERARGAEA